MLFLYTLCSFLINFIKAQNGLSEEEIVLITGLHNTYRSETDPTASGMPIMTFDTDLENRAQVWAKGCSYSNPNPSDPLYADVSSSISQQQDSFENRNFTAMVEDWHAIGRFYNFSTNECSATSCSNYLNIVSEIGNRIGCGFNLCSLGSENVNYLVCFYQVKLDTENHPYANGAPCTTCPIEYLGCMNNLCILEGSTTTKSTSTAIASDGSTETTCKPFPTTTDKYYPCLLGKTEKYGAVLSNIIIFFIIFYIQMRSV